MVSVKIIDSSLPRVGRKLRNPQHSFSLKSRPWRLDPFLIAPVLPGETLKNLLLQYRSVSSRLKSPLVGWWSESYIFYVKHRDLTSQASLLTSMHLDATTDVSSLRGGSQSLGRYHAAGGIDYVNFCLQRVVEEYFREEDDGAWNANLLDGLPMVCIGKNTGLESLRDQAAAAVTQDEELPGEVTELPFGVNSGTWANHYAQWENMRAQKLTAKSFEDWLAEWGVSTPEVIERENKPELIRYIREWQYPTNTVEPTTGVPSTALSVSVSERADKDRFFKEPGFIFGVQCFRPKVYFSNQKGNLTEFLDDAYGWLPPVLGEQTWTSLKNFAFGAGPLAGAAPSGGYWVDMRDLFIFGDQFVNYDLVADGTGSHVVLPDASYKARFATSAMADALFAAAAPANVIRTDGVCSLSILGKIANET